MAVVRTVVRGDSRYYYLVQTYRWAGEVHRKEKYLGTSPPANLRQQAVALERDVWAATWFATFEAVREGYRAHLQSLPPSMFEKEREQFIVEFTYDTNRIEGSTLTFQETADLLTDGISPRSKPMRDIRETQLHAALLRRLLIHPESIDLAHLISWHKAIFGETKPDIAGRIRDFEVRIERSRHVPPSALEVRPMLIEALRALRRHATLFHPVELAATFHFQFENIHPFGDGNGRIGRIALNMILFQAGFPMVNIPYTKRAGYYHALERASLKADPRPFQLWFFRRYLRDHRPWSRTRVQAGGST